MENKENYSILLKNSFREELFNNAIKKLGSQEKLAKYLNTRIKSRHIKRESVKNWKKAKHYFGYNLFIPLEIAKEMCRINEISPRNVLRKTIKFNPPWADFRKKKMLVKEKGIKIVEKKGEKYLDIYSVLPRKTLPSTRAKRKIPLFVKKSKSYIQLWSEASWQVSKIKLKRFIKIDELFFIGAAAYLSEGLTKSDNYNECISFGNSEPALINLFIKWLNSFLKDYKLSFSISYNGQNCDKKNIKAFWIKNIPYLKKTHRLKITEKPLYGSGLINNFGTLNTKISNTVLKSFVLNLLDIAKKLVLKRKDYILIYLNGLLASEGSVGMKNHTVREISIGCSYKHKEEKVFIGKLLKIIGVKFNEGKNKFVIANWNSFLIFYKQKLFKIKQVNSYSKKDRFLLGFRNHQKTQKLFRLQKFKKKEFTAREWQKIFGLKRYISSHKFLASLVKENILLFRFKKNVKYYYTNPTVRPFLESIWKLRDYRSLTI